MRKMIAAILLATTVASPALADRGGKGHGRGPERAERHERGNDRAARNDYRREPRAARHQPRMERGERGMAEVQRGTFARDNQRAAKRTERRVERIAERRQRDFERPRRERIVRTAERPAFRPAPRRERVKLAREAPRNWGQVRSAMAHRENAERRWQRDRVRTVREARTFIRRDRPVPTYRVARYVQRAYASSYYSAPAYAPAYGYAPAYAYAPAYSYAPDYDRGGFNLGGLGGIATTVLPLLLGSGLGDLGGLGGLGGGLLGGLTPSYATADPYDAYGYEPYDQGYAYSDPYAASPYDAGYESDALGLGGEPGSFAQLAGIALGSGLLGGGDLLGGGLSGLGSLGGGLGSLGGGGIGYDDPFDASPEALLAQSLGGLIV